MAIAMNDVVVLLPGILGSRLKKNGRDLWNFSGSAIVRALLTIGRDLDALVLQQDSGNLDDAGDGVVADGLLPDLHLIPGLWKIDGYARIRDTLLERFTLVPGRNFFEFAYDWRRDNRIAAKRLARDSAQWLATWRAAGHPNAKLILLGHSMGGLVSRYFLEVLDGWRDTRALFTWGTPYRGSLNALDALANGIRKGPFGLVDLSVLVRSLTSAYQLLPTYPCFDAGDGAPIRVDETTRIPNLDPARAKAALDFHREIAAAVDGHRGDADYRDHGYAKYGVIGIGQPTLQSAVLAGAGLTMRPAEAGGRDLRGDGTVPRPSATPPEITDGSWGMFASTAHASLQNADATLDHLTGVLSGIDLDLGGYRTMEAVLPTDFSVSVDDLFWEGEPVVATVEAIGRSTAADVAITAVADGATVRVQPLQLAAGVPSAVTIGPLPEGSYRLTVGRGTVEPATDVFMVAQRP